MRGQIITLKHNDYVRAAYAVGAKLALRVLDSHLLLNTLGVLVIVVFLELPGVILGEAFLSFIGLGINPPKPSWGTHCAGRLHAPTRPTRTSSLIPIASAIACLDSSSPLTSSATACATRSIRR